MSYDDVPAYERAARGLYPDPLSCLLIEDDPFFAKSTQAYLERHGVNVTWTSDAERGLSEVARRAPDIVLVALHLPALDGLRVLRALRMRSDVPVMLLTRHEDEADHVLALEIGADDYLAKPFSQRELLARIRAHVRRARGAVGPRASILRVGRLELSPDALEARLDGRRLALTGHEFGLLLALASQAGCAITREALMVAVRGNAEDAFDRSIDVQVSRLRRKLGDDPKRPALLKTIRGAGYMLVPGR